MSLRHLQSMKRRSPSPSPLSLPPSTPPTPQHISHFKPPFITSSKTSLTKTTVTSFSPNWTPLNIPNSELNLSLTLPTGQTFRWRQTGPLQYTGVVAGSYVVSLKECVDGNIWYCVHEFGNDDYYGAESLEKSNLVKNGSGRLLEKSNPDKNGAKLMEKSTLGKNGGGELLEKSTLDNNGDHGMLEKALFDKNGDDGAELLEKSLFDFLNMGISLSGLWGEFKANDERFAALAACFPGVRVLRQDPLECLIQFICSSNNNISRITKMVDYISALGRKLGSVGEFDFYAFPSLDRLAMVSEAELRDSGFGYRAKYIIGTVKALQSKPGGGVEWLTALRKSSLEDAVVALCTLPGVGPKVAACVALFSLDQHHAIPVDTHVWQIATRHLIPELAGTSLTPKLYSRVSDAFVSKYGQYAGWAQTLLFIADLPSQKAVLPSPSKTSAVDALVTQKEGKKKKVKRAILEKM